MRKIFITGIGTDVGKTVVASIVVEALEADYWKPIQAGDLEFSDTDRVKTWISNSRSVFHPNAYALKTPMSPHASAALDGVHIEPDEIREPVTSNDLVIEGAGGLLVPLNEQNTVLDLIRKDYRTILVSRNYLGSINHTLLSLEALRSRGLEVSGIIFNGERVPSTEQIIEKIGKVPVLGRIELEKTMDRQTVSKYAELLRNPLRQL